MDRIPDLTRRELAAVVLVAISFAVVSLWFSGGLVAAALRGVIGGVGTVVTLSLIRLPEADSTDGDAS